MGRIFRTASTHLRHGSVILHVVPCQNLESQNAYDSTPITWWNRILCVSTLLTSYTLCRVIWWTVWDDDYSIIFSSNFAWVMMTFFAPVSFLCFALVHALGPNGLQIGLVRSNSNRLLPYGVKRTSIMSDLSMKTLPTPKWPHSITVIMVSRLILNLRKLATSPVWRTPQFTLTMTRGETWRSSTLIDSERSGKTSARDDNDVPLQTLSHAATGGSYGADIDVEYYTAHDSSVHTRHTHV